MTARTTKNSQAAAPVDEPEGSPSNSDTEQPLQPTIAELLLRIVELQERLGDRPVNNAPHDPKVNPPTTFTGKTSTFQTFLMQVDLVFELSPNTYVTDDKKILFMISCMSGNALDLVYPIAVDPNHEYRQSLAVFRAFLSSIYRDTAYKAKMEAKYSSLTQTGSAQRFVEALETCFAALNIRDDSAKCYKLFNGLNLLLQTAVITQGRKSTWVALREQVVSLDQPLYHIGQQQHTEDGNKRSRSTTDTSSSSNQTKKPYQPSSSSLKPLSNRISNPPPSSGDTSSRPTSFFRAPLSDEEKKRRRDNGLCGYCGTKGHFADSCPNKKPPPTINQISFSPSYPTPSENPPSQQP